MKLCHLWLCINCDEVYDRRQSPGRRCPKCTSDEALPLSRLVRSLEIVRTAHVVSAHAYQVAPQPCEVP